MNLKNIKIDFILPVQSQYNVLHEFTKKIYEAFVRKGLNVQLISIEEAFENKNKSDFTFGINGVPFTEERKMLCDITGIPHFCFLVDPPFRFYELLTSKNIIYLSDDSYNASFIHSITKNDSLFMPHGADLLLNEFPEEDKIYDIIFMGTYIDYELIRKAWYEQFPKILAQTLDDSVEIFFDDGETSLIESFSKAYKERLGLRENVIPSDIEFMLPLSMLEMFIKGQERHKLLTSLSDFPIHLFGGPDINGKQWSDQLKNSKNIIYHESVNFENAIEVMRKSKIILNASAKNKEGGHERIFYGMACGGVVLTNYNIYLNQHFKDEENILFYETKNYLNVSEKVLKLLQNDHLRKEISKNGKEEVFKKHTWDHRIEVMIFYLMHLAENNI